MSPAEFLEMLRPTLHRRMMPTRQLAVLALLAHHKSSELDLGAVARELKFSKPALTRNVDALWGEGMVHRGNDSLGSDQRRVFLSITDIGAAFLK